MESNLSMKILSNCTLRTYVLNVYQYILVYYYLYGYEGNVIISVESSHFNTDHSELIGD